MEHEELHLDKDVLPDEKANASSSATILSDLKARLGWGDTLIARGTSKETLYAGLHSTDWKVRAAVANRLGFVGGIEDVPLLQACLQQDPIAAVRAAAARSLGELQEYLFDDKVLVAAMDHTDEDVRIAASEALKALREHMSQEAITSLIAHIEDKGEDEDVRATSLSALGELGERTPIDQLERALEDASWLVREAAALAMGKQGDKANVEALEALLTDPSASVCKATAYALGKIWKETSKHLSDDMPKGSEPKKDVSTPAPIIKGISTPHGPDPLVDTKKADEAKETRTFVNGNVTFDGLEPEDFVIDDIERVKVPVIVQALDNQWITLRLGKAMFQGKLSYKDVEAYLEGLVRTEYIRALINGEQVVINRAFLYNNSVLFEDYLREGSTRSVFKQFLQEGTIVPFLLYERSPNQRPVFGTNREGFTAWEQICEEVHMQCMRFSWDDERHKTALDQFTARYHSFLTSIETGTGRNIKKLAEDLGLASTDEYRLRKLLGEVHDLSTAHYRAQLEKQEREGKELSLHITRNILYQNYVTGGSNPAERLYDGAKPLAGEVKQLFDLAYNGFLADELNGYLLTPIDSPNRAILQEWEVASKEKAIFTGSDFIKILRSRAFDLLQEGLYLKSMGLLTLQDVQQIRSTEVWKTYIRSLQRLLKAPALFVERAPEVYSNYVALAKVMTDITVQRNRQHADDLKAPWEPSVEIVANIGGVPLSVVWNELGVFYKHIPARKPFIVSNNGDAPFNMRLIIGNKGARTTHTHARLFSSIELIKGKMPKALREWEKITQEISHILNAQEYSSDRVKETAVPTINEPGR